MSLFFLALREGPGFSLSSFTLTSLLVQALKLAVFVLQRSKACQKNIFSFSIKYLDNTLATRKNLCRYSISQLSACSFCLQAASLEHIFFSFKLYLEDTLGAITQSLFISLKLPVFQTARYVPISLPFYLLA